MPIVAQPRRVIHAIYWKLHTAYLRNNRREADRFLAMLLDESKGKDNSIQAEIGLPHFLRFNQIRTQIKAGRYGRLYGDGFETPPIAATYGTIQKSGDEREFCAKLSNRAGKDKIAVACGLTELSTMLTEVDLDEFGRVDFLIMEGRKQCAVEFKMGEAQHAVVAQIDKYRLGLEFDMCKGLYDEVLAAVAAEHFPLYVATELSRLSVMMLEHKGTIASIQPLRSKRIIHQNDGAGEKT